MARQTKKQYGSRAASSLALILILSVLVIEILAVGLIISYAYNNSRTTTLSISVIACDHVQAVSNESSSTLVVHNVHTGTVRFPINSRVIVNATPFANGYVFGWYVIGSAVNASNQGNGYVLTLQGNSSIGVACG